MPQLTHKQIAKWAYAFWWAYRNWPDHPAYIDDKYNWYEAENQLRSMWFTNVRNQAFQLWQTVCGSPNQEALAPFMDANYFWFEAEDIYRPQFERMLSQPVL